MKKIDFNKAIETPSSIKRTVKELKNTIRILSDAKGNAEFFNLQQGMIKDLERNIEIVKETKSWLFNFESGGWNSAIAPSKAEAYKKAVEEFEAHTTPGHKPLFVKKSSFRIRTDSDEKQLLSLFY